MMTCCNMHMLSDVLCSGNSVQQTYYEITEDECEQSSLVLGKYHKRWPPAVYRHCTRASPHRTQKGRSVTPSRLYTWRRQNKSFVVRFSPFPLQLHQRCSIGNFGVRSSISISMWEKRHQQQVLYFSLINEYYYSHWFYTTRGRPSITNDGF